MKPGAAKTKLVVFGVLLAASAGSVVLTMAFGRDWSVRAYAPIVRQGIRDLIAQDAYGKAERFALRTLSASPAYGELVFEECLQYLRVMPEITVALRQVDGIADNPDKLAALLFARADYAELARASAGGTSASISKAIARARSEERPVEIDTALYEKLLSDDDVVTTAIKAELQPFIDILRDTTNASQDNAFLKGAAMFHLGQIEAAHEHLQHWERFEAEAQSDAAFMSGQILERSEKYAEANAAYAHALQHGNEHAGAARGFLRTLPTIAP